MRSLITVFALLALVTIATVPATAHVGCTPGFWKNNTSYAVWGPTGYAPTNTLAYAFPGVTTWAKYGINPGDSLLTALGYQGGSGLNGAAQVFLRTAVASLLNAAEPDLGFIGPVGGISAKQWVIDTVTANLNINSCFIGPGLCGTDDGLRTSLLALASQWDAFNNEVPCAIDAHGNLIG